MEVKHVKAFGAEQVRDPRRQVMPRRRASDRSTGQQRDRSSNPYDPVLPIVLLAVANERLSRVADRGEIVSHLRGHDSNVMAQAACGGCEMMYVFLNPTKGRVVIF